MGNLRQARGRPLHLRRQHSLPNLFFAISGPTSSFILFPDRPDPTGNQANQGTEAQSYVSGPALKEPALVHGAVSAAHCSFVAHSPQTRPLLSGERNDLAPPAQTMGAYIFGLSMGAFRPSRECAKYYFSGLSTIYDTTLCP